jgi:hypothetical protein
MYLVAGVVNVVLIWMLWSTDLLPRPDVVIASTVTGILLQSLAPTHSLPWFAGLLINTGTAIYLITLFKLRW